MSGGQFDCVLPIGSKSQFLITLADVVKTRMQKQVVHPGKEPKVGVVRLK